jgi:hypothetical protein
VDRSVPLAVAKALFLFFFFSQIKMDVILRHWQTFEAEIKHA